MKNIYREILDVMGIIKTKIPNANIKEIVMCTNHLHCYLEWTKWFKEVMRETTNKNQ
jgi:hypothetical protein